MEHPAVVEAAVVASPDAVRGEIVKAFVILAPGYTASDELARSCRTTSSRSPRRISIRARSSSSTELPKTISGKIRRVELRERERARRL